MVINPNALIDKFKKALSDTTEATNAAAAAREADETYRMSWAYDADGDVVVTVP